MPERSDKYEDLIPYHRKNGGNDVSETLKEVEIKKTEQRIREIKKELTLENYWDGFTLKGFRTELEELEKNLLNLKKHLSD